MVDLLLVLRDRHNHLDDHLCTSHTLDLKGAGIVPAPFALSACRVIGPLPSELSSSLSVSYILLPFLSVVIRCLHFVAS